jgi:hypothetical protein
LPGWATPALGGVRRQVGDTSEPSPLPTFLKQEDRELIAGVRNEH